MDNEDIMLPLFTIVYCHEGEFKVLFNTQYRSIV